ncbi:MAG: hypothetical protein IPJ37_24555 [Bacteroidales bacterium]|nr:hypothetical protein [Bacteroidales bacterium]
MNKKLTNRSLTLLLIIAGSILSGVFNNSLASESAGMRLNVIPFPKQVNSTGSSFSFRDALTIVLDKNILLPTTLLRRN